MVRFIRAPDGCGDVVLGFFCRRPVVDDHRFAVGLLNKPRIAEIRVAVRVDLEIIAQNDLFTLCCALIAAVSCVHCLSLHFSQLPVLSRFFA